MIGPCAKHAKPPQPKEQCYDDRRGSSAARGYGYAWQQKRKDYLKRNPFCVRCRNIATDVDHILPLRFGGADDESNYQALCGGCHKSKTARERRMK